MSSSEYIIEVAECPECGGVMDPQVLYCSTCDGKETAAEYLEREARRLSPGGWMQIEEARRAYDEGREDDVLLLLHNATTSYLQDWCKLLHIPFEGGLSRVFYDIIEIANEGGPPDSDDLLIESTLWILDPVGMTLIRAERGWRSDLFTRVVLQDREAGDGPTHYEVPDKAPKTLRFQR